MFPYLHIANYQMYRYQLFTQPKRGDLEKTWQLSQTLSVHRLEQGREIFGTRKANIGVSLLTK